MTEKHWERVKEIFDCAIRLQGPERDELLDRLCNGSPELRNDVQDLLKNHEEAKSFLDPTLTLPECAPVFHTGQIVAGRFLIRRFIERGGMGEVYEAFDQKLRLRVALKTLRAEFARDEHALERFRREICVAREVAHESICRVFDLVEYVPTDDSGSSQQPVPCLTMELLEGTSLADYLKDRRPLDPKDAIEILEPIGVALDILHEHGIVHRDLKPSNIMLVPRADGRTRVVVMDFGLAKPSLAGMGMFETRVDLCAGTPYFAAPEQLRGERPSTASDIYSFGLIIDEMVTSSRAFPADSLHGLYYQKLWGQPVPPAERREGIPECWEQTILQCLDPVPSKRPERSRDVVAGLRGAARPIANPIQPHRHVPDVVRRGALLAGLVLLASVLAAEVTARVHRQPQWLVSVYDIANTTGHAELDYLGKGTTLAIIREFTQSPDLRVVAMHEPRTAKSRRDSNARFTFEGTLENQAEGVRFRFTVTDSRGGEIWSNRFDRAIGDTLTVQTEAASSAIQSMQERVKSTQSPEFKLIAAYQNLTGRVRNLLIAQADTSKPQPATANKTAWDLYLRGRALWDERTLDGSLAAIKSFQRALDSDPNFGLAYAALADVHLTLMEHRYRPQMELLQAARMYAERAVAVSPEFAETYLSLAAVKQQLWDWQGSESAYIRAISLNPQCARAHRWYGGMIIQFGRFDEGLKEAHIALELDPYDYAAHSAYGVYLHYAGRNQEAAEHLERALAEKDFIYTHVILGNVYSRLAVLAKGQASNIYFQKAFQQAALVADRERKTTADHGWRLLPLSDGMFANYYALSGDPSTSRKYLKRILNPADRSRASNMDLAEIYLALGERDKALALLEQAAEDKDKSLVYLKVYPFFDRLRSSPRFQALERRLRL